MKIILPILKILSNVHLNSSENAIASSSGNTILEPEIDFHQSGQVDHSENESWLEKTDDERIEELTNCMAKEMSGHEVVHSYNQHIKIFEESDLGKRCVDIIESLKGDELSSESLHSYIKQIEKIEESEPLVEELKILLEQIKVGNGSFWSAIFQPSTSGTIRATKPVIEGFINAFKLLSENLAVRKIAKELFTHLGEEALENAREMIQSSQSSSNSPEKKAELLTQVQAYYDRCKNQ